MGPDTDIGKRARDLLHRDNQTDQYSATGVQALIFGSFTEDEARLFQGKSTENDKHVESVKLQFGSLDFTSLSLREGLGAQAKQIDSSVRSKDAKTPKPVINERVIKDGKNPASNVVRSKTVTQSNGNTRVCSSLSNGVVKKETKAPKMVRDERTCKDGKTLASNVVQNISVAQTNGSSHHCSSTLSNGVIKKDAISPASGLMHISETETSIPEILATPEVHYDGVERNTNCDRIANSSSIPTVESQKIPSDHAHHVKALLPRGLMNPGNLCFLNATLQGLLSCLPFVQLLQDLRTRNIPKIGYPTLRAFVEFISDFDMPNESTKNNEKGVLGTGKSFSPVMFATVLQKFTPDLPNHLIGRPRQEDAQEFLSFVMDQMHDELLKLEGQLSSSNGQRLSLVSSADDDGWETVGPKNKSAVTRIQSFMPSELSAIFGGQLRSVVKARGNKDSATVQPFLLLHLDIYPEVVHSVEDALHLFSAPETLDGYRTSTGKGGGIVSASKSLKIQTLPKIMILHLMRFSYGNKGSTKLHKPIYFPPELVLGRELLASPYTEGRKYELVATITHHGREPSKGHYTADARYSDGQWLRYDDANVMAVGVNKVLHDHAYLLFYKQV